MKIYNKITFVAFLIFAVSCATQSPSENSPVLATQTENIPTNSHNSASTTKHTQDVESSQKNDEQKRNVLTYFYSLYPKNSGKPVAMLSIEEKDIKNGYLKVTGAMEGYYIFALFKSPDADWIIQQNSGCGPECNQTFKVYKFVNGKLEPTKKFESLYLKNKVDLHIVSLLNKLPKGHTNEDLQSWLRLPKTGTSIDILILEQNPGHTSGKVGVYQAGRLDWNGSGFNFVKQNPRTTSSIDIKDVQ